MAAGTNLFNKALSFLVEITECRRHKDPDGFPAAMLNDQLLLHSTDLRRFHGLPCTVPLTGDVDVHRVSEDFDG